MAFSKRKVEFLERECIKEANRVQRSGKISREAFLQMRIQTCSPIERLAILLCALAAGGISAWLFLAKKEAIAGCVYSVVGVLLIIVAAFGRRSAVESVFRGIDGAVTARILDVLF